MDAAAIAEVLRMQTKAARAELASTGAVRGETWEALDALLVLLTDALPAPPRRTRIHPPPLRQVH